VPEVRGAPRANGRCPDAGDWREKRLNSSGSVCAVMRCIATQATKVFFADDSGHQMGRLS